MHNNISNDITSVSDMPRPTSGYSDSDRRSHPCLHWLRCTRRSLRAREKPRSPHLRTVNDIGHSSYSERGLHAVSDKTGAIHPIAATCRSVMIDYGRRAVKELAWDHTRALINACNMYACVNRCARCGIIEQLFSMVGITGMVVLSRTFDLHALLCSVITLM